MVDEDSIELVVPIELTAEYNLQNVIAFPVAFTNSALHKVELLKLTQKIGAPNHAFQSLMEWARKANENNNHFQPPPKVYGSQTRSLMELVSMDPCCPTVFKVSLEQDDLVIKVCCLSICYNVIIPSQLPDAKQAQKSCY